MDALKDIARNVFVMVGSVLLSVVVIVLIIVVLFYILKSNFTPSRIAKFFFAT